VGYHLLGNASSFDDPGQLEKAVYSQACASRNNPP